MTKTAKQFGQTTGATGVQAVADRRGAPNAHKKMATQIAARRNTPGA
jgi:hypothetical protein